METAVSRKSYRRILFIELLQQVHTYFIGSQKKIHLSFSNIHGSSENSHFSRPSTPRGRFSYFAGSSWQPKNDKNQLPAFQSNIVWVVLSDEQMSKRWPFPIVNDQQMSISRGLSTGQLLVSIRSNCWVPESAFKHSRMLVLMGFIRGIVRTKVRVRIFTAILVQIISMHT